MFSFFNEFGLCKEMLSYKYVNLNGEKVYVQGFKNLLCFDDKSIILKLKDNEMEIVGERLNIEELSQNTILVTGKIICVKVD